MKIADAMRIMAGESMPLVRGYRINFEHKVGNMLRGDYFPDRLEPAIETEEAAWRIARAFADKTVGKCVNIRVVTDNLMPVAGDLKKTIENRGELCDCRDHPDQEERCSPVRGGFRCDGSYGMPSLPPGMMCRRRAEGDQT